MKKRLGMVLAVCALAMAINMGGALVKQASAEPTDLVVSQQTTSPALIVRADGKLTWKADKDTVAHLLLSEIERRSRAAAELAKQVDALRKENQALKEQLRAKPITATNTGITADTKKAIEASAASAVEKDPQADAAK